MINRCQAGLDRNSHGCGGKAICSLSMLINHSEILHSHQAATNHRIRFRQFSFDKGIFTSKNNRIFSTLVLNNFAGIKCPNS
jgi:hypothetical protein